MAQYGEKRRITVALQQSPTELVKAFIATDDSRFQEHHGVEHADSCRAASVAMLSGHYTQGASPLTQQFARNFFLSPETTLMRKIKEATLAPPIKRWRNK
ncbi:hypothetical protein CSC88_35245, partial [Klebsiella pneumoniae]